MFARVVLMFAFFNLFLTCAAADFPAPKNSLPNRICPIRS